MSSDLFQLWCWTGWWTPALWPDEKPCPHTLKASYLCGKAPHTSYTCGLHLPLPRSCRSCRLGHTSRGRSPRSYLQGQGRKVTKATPGVPGPHTIASCSPTKEPMKRASNPLVLFTWRTKNERLPSEKESSSRVLTAYQTMVRRNIAHHRQETDGIDRAWGLLTGSEHVFAAHFSVNSTFTTCG